jgi:hypothetical protein
LPEYLDVGRGEGFGGSDEDPYPVASRGLLRLGRERRGEDTGQRGQEEAAAVHYSIT